ncbi:MAG: hypothetical protein IT521_16520 [Burkholderiales bacterium]|nr:hypothetical protein [Burkholderiales bacterium]
MFNRHRQIIAAAWALAAASIFVLSPLARAADTGTALYAKLVQDPVPAKLRGKAQAQALDVPADERAQGVVGSILVSVAADRSHLRYFVFATRDDAARGYRRYVAQPWGSPMRRLAQEEFTPEQNMAPGVLTCELQRNDRTGVHVSACLHLHKTLPVLTRSTLPVKFDNSLKFSDPKVEQMRYTAAAADSVGLLGDGTLQVVKVAGR